MIAPAVAQRAVPAGTLRSGTLSFDGRATVGDFTGTTSTITGAMTGGLLTEVRGWVEAPVDSLKTGNGKRDKDLRKSMESDKYPAIRFDLDGADLHTETADSALVTLRGRFTIHGVEREVQLPARIHFHGQSLRVMSDFPLNLKDYKIGGLSKMLGILKMHPDITVHVDLLFESSPASAAPPAGAPVATPPPRG